MGCVVHLDGSRRARPRVIACHRVGELLLFVGCWSVGERERGRRCCASKKTNSVSVCTLSVSLIITVGLFLTAAALVWEAACVEGERTPPNQAKRAPPSTASHKARAERTCRKKTRPHERGERRREGGQIQHPKAAKSFGNTANKWGAAGGEREERRKHY